MILADICCYLLLLSCAFSALTLLGGREGIRPVKQEAQRSPSDQAMRLVSSYLANYHATVQKLLIWQVLTKPMVWSWRFSWRQCHKQTDDGRVVYITCILTTCCGKIFLSPQCRSWLTWPWPRPLRKHRLITKLRLCMADPCTKFEVSSFSRCGEITRGVKF